MLETTPTPQRGGFTLWTKSERGLNGLFATEDEAQAFLDENFAAIESVLVFDSIVTIMPYEMVCVEHAEEGVIPDPRDPEGEALLTPDDYIALGGSDRF